MCPISIGFTGDPAAYEGAVLLGAVEPSGYTSLNVHQNQSENQMEGQTKLKQDQAIFGWLELMDFYLLAFRALDRFFNIIFVNLCGCRLINDK